MEKVAQNTLRDFAFIIDSSITVVVLMILLVITETLMRVSGWSVKSHPFGSFFTFLIKTNSKTIIQKQQQEASERKK